MGLLLVLSIFALGGHPQTQVSFCDLVRHPELYRGKEVTVRATHKYGFEWSELYCLDCLDKGKAWLGFTHDLDDTSERALKRVPKYAGIVNLTVHGTFHGPGGYGHLNGYRYEFVADKVSSVVVISKGMKPVEEERRLERVYACGGSNPK